MQVWSEADEISRTMVSVARNLGNIITASFGRCLASAKACLLHTGTQDGVRMPATIAMKQYGNTR
jgi:hypothetical protein